MKELVSYYKRIVEWNEKCGVKDELPHSFPWWKAMKLQTSLLLEEAKESVDGARFEDPKELLDGTVDTFVILAKQMDMLGKAGYDVVGALEAICNNNDMKIFNSYYEACDAKEKLEFRDDTEYFIETSVVDGLPYYTTRKASGKVAKPADFVPVDLSKFIPEE